MAHPLNYFVIAIASLLLLIPVEARPAINEGNQNPAVMCKLPAMKGHCRALLLRWRYNPTIGKCEEFNWGGCDGNGNNFVSYKACMAICQGVS